MIAAMEHRMRQPPRAHRVVMLGFPQAQVLDITGPLEVFARTSRWLAEHRGWTRPGYETALVAARAGSLETSGGLKLQADSLASVEGRIDTLLVSGGIGWEQAARDARLLAWITAQLPKVQRLGSICNGALLLAAAGLLKGRRATTHWAWLDRLAALAPGATIERDALYVRSGKVWTSAGVTAGMDLSLALIEHDHGKATALAVAQELVLFLRRPGGQSQFSRHLQAERRDDLFGELELWMFEHLDADLSVASLAARASMSPRHFARLFTERLGSTPAAYVRRLRVEAARRRIEQGATRLKQLARECGFGDEQALRRSFRALVGVTPDEYRQRF